MSSVEPEYASLKQLASVFTAASLALLDAHAKHARELDVWPVSYAAIDFRAVAAIQRSTAPLPSTELSGCAQVLSQPKSGSDKRSDK